MSPAALAAAFRRARARTDRIFEWVEPAAWYERPIPLRHPLVFYLGHLDAFNDTRLQRRLGLASTDPALDTLFERGIDPSDAGAARRLTVASWPTVAQVRAYTARLRERFFATLERAEPDACRELFPLLLEHELMHQETLLYMLRELPDAHKRPPSDLPALPVGRGVEGGRSEIPEGVAMLGHGGDGFGWDNEYPRHAVAVPAFAIDRTNVTNGDFLAFMEEGGYRHRRFWSDRTWAWLQERSTRHPPRWRRVEGAWHERGLFAETPLALDHPVVVTHAEAAAYARYVGKELPSEAEWHRVVGEAPVAGGNFDFRYWSSVPVGACGAGPHGVADMVGNGWEWTRTPFAPFEGFVASEIYPEYSADFFDGEHYVLKGASWFTDRHLVRPSLRNWFYGHYPYMDATFRCVERERSTPRA